MKLNERHTRLAIGALYYAEIALCFTLKPPQAAGFAAAVLLPLAMQLLSAIGSRQWNCLAAAFTLMPAGAVAGSIACASAPLQVSAFLPGLLLGCAVRIVNGLRRWPDTRPNTLRWTGAAVAMVTFAATAALILA